MSNLIPLLTIFIYSFCHSSGHHRGEEDIELSKPIMRFLAKVREDTYDDSIEDPLEGTIPLRRLSISINRYIHESQETKHYNSPVTIAIYSKEEQ